MKLHYEFCFASFVKMRKKLKEQFATDRIVYSSLLSTSSARDCITLQCARKRKKAGRRERYINQETNKKWVQLCFVWVVYSPNSSVTGSTLAGWLARQDVSARYYVN